VPPHWFVPIKASDPKGRKKDVETALTQHGGSLKSFWMTPDQQQLFALIQADNLTHPMLVAIKANGKAIPLEDV
jgi:hypothetical protein